MMPILQMLLKVLDHAQRQRRINLARAIDAADAREEHRLGALGGARTRGGGFRGADDGVGGV